MRRDRISVTVSPHMTVALELLAERSGLSPATQAMVTLRQALARTMDSAECRQRLAKRQAYRTAAEWREDVGAERYVETALEGAGRPLGGAEGGSGGQ